MINIRNAVWASIVIGLLSVFLCGCSSSSMMEQRLWQLNHDPYADTPKEHMDMIVEAVSNSDAEAIYNMFSKNVRDAGLAEEDIADRRADPQDAQDLQERGAHVPALGPEVQAPPRHGEEGGEAQDQAVDDGDGRGNNGLAQEADRQQGRGHEGQVAEGVERQPGPDVGRREPGIDRAREDPRQGADADEIDEEAHHEKDDELAEKDL